MAVEIERKFLVRLSEWQPSQKGKPITQGYLCLDPDRSVRVRLSGDQAFLTVKGGSEGARRLEFEYSVPPEDARQLLDLCHAGVIEKTRYKIEFKGHIWDVDEFHGVNSGLALAEIELESEEADFERPPWVGEEVTGDQRYFNLYLVEHPFSRW